MIARLAYQAPIRKLVYQGYLASIYNSRAHLPF